MDTLIGAAETAHTAHTTHTTHTTAVVGTVGTAAGPDGAGEPDEPDETHPAAPLYVPVRLGSAGGRQLCFLRTPPGTRTAVGFTTPERLAAVFGEGHRWIRLAEPALRVLAEPLGVTAVAVDPRPTAPVTRRGAGRGAPAPVCGRRAAGGPDAWGVLGSIGFLRTTAGTVHPFLD
ncbi:SAV_915 family protein [Streptomyces yaizuensis]|uniref:SseB protein N-terminal domain-containing protein n=1 Tax=Streptomyces yaizuensis TaxID=2989713 RepID=A0ABQ5P5S9_9ACTN|nr:SAV_915 family protein [Streptomyces sp. YSPA8]GLF97952.1 hypothetical protein SYYSPA8_26665 [Streptomyces sp. YSPA8]